MNSGIRHNNKKPNRDEVRRLFLLNHSDTPSALLGESMEREAYLDVLIPKALDAAAMPRKRR